MPAGSVQESRHTYGLRRVCGRRIVKLLAQREIEIIEYFTLQHSF